MPTLKNKKSVGRLAQSLRKIKNKPRVEEDEADLIEFDDEELTDKALSGGDNRALEDKEASIDSGAKASIEEISIPDPVIIRNEPTNEMLRIAVIENKLRKEFKESQAKPIEPKPKIKASDIQKMIKESIKESIKEQLAEELKQRDTIKEQRRLEKAEIQRALEARELERQTIKEKLAEQLKEEKRIKDEQLKEERKKQKALDAKKERELLRQELETGIKIREEQIKNALNLQIRKVRSSALLS